jgi:NADPH2:quinone reductase
MMKAAVLNAIGSTPVYRKFRDPEIGEGEVLVKGRASSIKRIDRSIAAGSHYTSHDELPSVIGIDGIGELENGRRVYFGGIRAPFGTMAELVPARAGYLVPLEADLDDVTAAALPNAAMSSWLPLSWHAKLQQGETVLILGATGTSGRLAIQVARHLGAGKIVIAGRNQAALDALRRDGADAAVALDGADDDVVESFIQAGGDTGYDVVLDYLWGKPAELFASALLQAGLDHATRKTRMVQVGAAAGEHATLPASVLRGTGLLITGSGVGSVDPKEIFRMIPEVWSLAAAGKLQMDTEEVPLKNIETAWQRGDRDGKRQVVTIG